MEVTMHEVRDTLADLINSFVGEVTPELLKIYQEEFDLFVEEHGNGIS